MKVASDCSDRRADLVANINTLAGVAQVDNTAGASNIWNRATGIVASNTNEAITYYQHALTKGSGIYRVKIRSLTDANASLLYNGFITGVSSKNVGAVLGSGLFTNPDIDYGVFVGLSTGNYHSVINGVFQDTGADRVINIRITSDPYADPPSSLFNGTAEYEGTDDLLSLSSPSPPQQTILPSNTFIDLGSVSLAKFLGFENQRQPVGGFELQRHFYFQGDNKFNMLDVADSFMVILDNIQLKCYDDFDKEGYGKGGRQNILAVVPESDSDNVVIYEPNNLVFVDLDNSNPINVRNIKARIVKNDYGDMVTAGLSTITLLLKNDKE